MAAGRTLGKYVSDLLHTFDNTGATVAATFAVDVPNNLFAEASLGWAAATAGDPRLPKRLRPRHVIGVNAASGRRARVIVATLTATLWTGAATTWTSIQNDGTSITYTVTGRVGEATTIVG